MTEFQLNQYLQADAEIAAITADRVFNGTLPEGVVLPAVTFEYVSDSPVNTLDGDTGKARTRYTINAWASTYEEVQALKAVIQTAMITNPRLAAVPLHEPENSLYRIAIDYSLFS